MNVIFLDYDGVVNTPVWHYNILTDNYYNSFNFTADYKVSNYNAVQWVSEFCQKYNYKIVVTSSWRLHDNYKECLINGGLRNTVEIAGKTRLLSNREDEIAEYLNTHPEIDNYVIVDDEYFGDKFVDHWVKTDTLIGFTEREYRWAVSIHERFKNRGKNHGT